LKDIPEALREKQNKTRQNTEAIVNKGINELRSEGYLISIKLLVERTGLSRSVFRKEHVRKLLEECKIGKYAERKTLYRIDQPYVHMKNIRRELEKANNKIERLQMELNNKKLLISDLKSSLEKKNNECELLRGEIFMLHKKILINDIKK
jgi:predicted RNase H-like nuclease (RuvC/YqgF family)